MRLRRRHRRTKQSGNADTQPLVCETGEVKEAVPIKPINPMRVLKQFANNPDLGFQVMTFLLTMSSDNVRMDRRLDSMTTTVDKVRNATEMINNTMRSLKSAAETPSQIKRLFK